MCQRLFVASYQELPTFRKSKRSPYLGVQRLPEDLKAVRAKFPSEYRHLYLAEANAPCGCGFPEEVVGSKPRSVKIQPEDRMTMAKLIDHLRPVVRGRPRVQLLLGHVGEEDEASQEGPVVTLRQLGDPGFRFRNGERVTVVRGGVEHGVEADEA